MDYWAYYPIGDGLHVAIDQDHTIVESGTCKDGVDYKVSWVSGSKNGCVRREIGDWYFYTREKTRAS